MLGGPGRIFVLIGFSAGMENSIWRALINDLEMSFGRVGVIHEIQFQNSAISAGMSPAQVDELSHLIGLSTAVNQELPAIVIIEKIRDQIKEGATPETLDQIKEVIAPISVNNNHENTPKVAETTDIKVESATPKFDSYIDMSMIKLSANGYVGNFLDRHLIYSIEDQNRIINLESGTRTCQVTRRFSDFVEVRDYLLVKFPFRCIPKLPAKRVQMFTDEAFLLDRQKSLRRFIGIICHHHLYKSDPLIQAFFYNQKGFQDLISDSKFISADTDHMLLTQIPSADALVQANMKEALTAIEKGRSESQALVKFCVQIRDQVKGLIDTVNRESNCLTKLSSALTKSCDVTGCLCSGTCQNCTQDQESRKIIGSKFTAITGTTEANTIIEFEEIVEKYNLLIDLFESFNDLMVRGNLSKHNNFDEIRKEIGVLEAEIEKRRASNQSEDESIERIQHRIDGLKQEWDEQDTFNKFIQYSMHEEMKWVHEHKVMMKHLLDQVALTIALKQRQWIAIFDS